MRELYLRINKYSERFQLFSFDMKRLVSTNEVFLEIKEKLQPSLKREWLDRTRFFAE